MKKDIFISLKLNYKKGDLSFIIQIKNRILRVTILIV
jgi:hypothetical protein